MIKQIPTSSKQNTYVLMDSWYSSESVLEASAKQGFHVISGLKTNRIIYPQGIRQPVKDFSSYVAKSDTDLVTVGMENHRVYRYEGKLNILDNAVVLLCWRDGDDFDPAKMIAFLSTDVSLTNEQILTYYSRRWSIETYFRSMKVHLGMDRYQVRSKAALDRFFALLTFVSLCCAYIGENNFIKWTTSLPKKKAS